MLLGIIVCQWHTSKVARVLVVAQIVLQLWKAAKLWVLVRLRLLQHVAHRPCTKLVERRLLSHLLSLSHVGILAHHIIKVAPSATLALAKVFVAFLDREENLAAFVAKLTSLLPELIFVVHLPPRFLCVLHVVVVDEGVGAILGVRLRLFHPDGPHSSILLKHCLEGCLIWQL